MTSAGVKVKKSKYFNIGHEQTCPNFASEEGIIFIMLIK